MTLRLNGTTSGYTELDSPAIGNNNLLTLPTTTAGTLIAANSSGVVQMNSGYGSNANAYGCRAWVTFNGTGTVAIRASGNVSSITDNGTGRYTVNFSTALADVNYSTVVTSSTGNSGQTWLLSDAGPNLNSGAYSSTYTTTSSIRILGGNSSNSVAYDAAMICVAIFR